MTVFLDKIGRGSNLNALAQKRHVSIIGLVELTRRAMSAVDGAGEPARRQAVAGPGDAGGAVGLQRIGGAVRKLGQRPFLPIIFTIRQK